MKLRSYCLAALLAIASLPIAAQNSVAGPSAPAVDARAYILVDHATGQTLASLNPDQRVEPASITKLMTAYVAFQALKEGRLRLQDPVPISEHAWRAEGSRTFLQVGDRVPAEVLLLGMIVQSGNDAAIALAERLAGSESTFAQLMNETARTLGMKNSNFTNSTGLPDPALYTTPQDIALLSRAMIREFPQYYRWYSQREYVWNNIRQSNRNGLLYRDPSVDGIKTGHTESAGYCLASSAERDGTRMIAIVFGSSSPKRREDASAALLDYGFAFYETVTLRKAGEKVLQPRLYKGTNEAVTLVPAVDVSVTVNRGARKNLRVTSRVDEPLVAPLATGQRVGELLISDGSRLLRRVPLVVGSEATAGGVWPQLRDSVALWFR